MEPENLTPYAHDCFQKLKSGIPDEIGCRLKCSQRVSRHGKARTVYLFNVWDRHQTNLFDRRYFCYCLGYDPQNIYSPSTWYLHLWINTIRIYQYSEPIRRALIDIVRKQCPPSFSPTINENSVQAIIRSGFSGRLDRFVDHFLPLYTELVASFHPYLMPIIDSFTYTLTPEEREDVIASRQKLYLGPRKRLSAEQIRMYSRSIPRSWREQLLRKARNKCCHCRKAIDTVTAHIDHIVPFSKGGMTVISNLQPLCVSCNLTKGNRYFR
jgi:5-methylcytosine-specific restriction endonuclease McrA